MGFIQNSAVLVHFIVIETKSSISEGEFFLNIILYFIALFRSASCVYITNFVSSSYYPAHACASRGLCDRSWCPFICIYYKYTLPRGIPVYIAPKVGNIHYRGWDVYFHKEGWKIYYITYDIIKIKDTTVSVVMYDMRMPSIRDGLVEYRLYSTPTDQSGCSISRAYVMYICMYI